MDIPVGLELRVVDVDPDYVRIELAAGDGMFAGATDLYSGESAIADLARVLAGFPRTPDDRRTLELGTREERYADGWARLEATCIDRAGHVRLSIWLLDKDRGAGVAREAQLHFGVEAAALDTFVRALATLPLEEGQSVMLAGAS